MVPTDETSDDRAHDRDAPRCLEAVGAVVEVALTRELRCQKRDRRESERPQPRLERLGREEGDPRLARFGGTLREGFTRGPSVGRGGGGRRGGDAFRAGW